MKRTMGRVAVLGWLCLALFTLVDSRASFASIPDYDYPRVHNVYLRSSIPDSVAVRLSKYDVVSLAPSVKPWTPNAIDTIRARNPEITILGFLSTELVFRHPPDPNYFPVEHAHRESVLANNWILLEADGDTVSSWGDFFYSINNSIKAPVGSSGKRYYEWYAGFLKESMHDSSGAWPYHGWDGYWLDNVWDYPYHPVSPPDSLDLDLDGIGDPPDSLAAWWQPGAIQLVESVRDSIGPDHVIIVNGTNEAYAANGHAIENMGGPKGTPDGSLPYAFPWRHYVTDSWWAYFNQFDDYDSSLVPITTAMANWKEGTSTLDAPDTTADMSGLSYQANLRLWLGSTLLQDGFFHFSHTDSGYAGLWWSWMYEIELGYPEGDYYTTIGSHGDTLYCRDFTNGIVVVNPTDYHAHSVNGAPCLAPWDAYIGPPWQDRQYLSGTISSNATYPETGYLNLYLPADLKVATGVELTIRPCTRIYVADSDSANIGSTLGSSSTVDILVDGTLTLPGTAEEPIWIQSDASSPAAGDWGGILLDDSGAALDARHLSLSHAVYGVRSAEADTLRIVSGAFNESQTAAIRAAASLAGGIVIDATTIDFGAGDGILLEGAGPLTVSDCEITGNSSSSAGISVDLDFGGCLLEGNEIDGLSTGYGLEILDGGADLYENDVSGCLRALHVTSDSVTVGSPTDNAKRNIFTGNTTGIYALGCSPLIRRNDLSGNGTGVIARSGAAPDLGTSSSDKGNNKISGSSSSCINNLNKFGTPQVPAQGNYFGACSGGLPPSCWSGNVDIGNNLCTAPFSEEFEAVPVEPVGLRLIGAFPNPTRSALALEYVVGVDGSTISANIYSVSGRLIRSLGTFRAGPGRNRLHWDGRTEVGRAAPTGFYFVRLRDAEGREVVSKVMILR